MDIIEAKLALDKIIKKARVHLYKPIQIAEILHKDRTEGNIDLSDLETYRTKSRKWRDEICVKFLGRTSTSSARYQDDVFNGNALPPIAITELGKENRNKYGAVEAYIYSMFEKKYTQMNSALVYCNNKTKDDFILLDFINLFWREPGLKRSIDKIFEIVVYALFESLVEGLRISVEVSIDPSQMNLLHEFEDFTVKVLGLSSKTRSFTTFAKFHRAGVTNAADRGLDIWTNFGPAVQIKHLSLDVDLAEDITSTVTADKIVIVCKDAEHDVILSLLKQIGWKSRIQAVVLQSDLEKWYEKALRGQYNDLIAEKLLRFLQNEIIAEFPSQSGNEFRDFFEKRGYHRLKDTSWQINAF